jgi:hypothetical protein
VRTFAPSDPLRPQGVRTMGLVRAILVVDASDELIAPPLNVSDADAATAWLSSTRPWLSPTPWPERFRRLVPLETVNIGEASHSTIRNTEYESRDRQGR